VGDFHKPEFPKKKKRHLNIAEDVKSELINMTRAWDKEKI